MSDQVPPQTAFVRWESCPDQDIRIISTNKQIIPGNTILQGKEISDDNRAYYTIFEGLPLYLKMFHVGEVSLEIIILKFLEEREFPTTRILDLGTAGIGRKTFQVVILEELPGYDLFDYQSLDLPSKDPYLHNSIRFTNVVRKFLLQVVHLLDLGILHADLYFGNILLHRDGVFLIDFGNIRIVKDSAAWKYVHEFFPSSGALRGRITPGIFRGFLEQFLTCSNDDKLTKYLNDDFVAALTNFEYNEKITDAESTKAAIYDLLTLLE